MAGRGVSIRLVSLACPNGYPNGEPRVCHVAKGLAQNFAGNPLVRFDEGDFYG